MSITIAEERDAQLGHIKALAARERAVAEFFRVCTELLELCEPLVKAAVDEAATKRLVPKKVRPT